MPLKLGFEDSEGELTSSLFSPLRRVTAVLTHTHQVCAAALVLVVTASSTTTHADQPAASIATSTPEQEDHFLFKGGRYRIVFPKTFELFTVQSTEISQSTSRVDDKVVSTSPVTWRITFKCEHFVVTELGPRAWIQVEHPVAKEDYGKWTGKLLAIQALEREDIGENERVIAKDRSEITIPTARTWINLDHAIAVQNLTEPRTNVVSSVSAVQSN